MANGYGTITTSGISGLGWMQLASSFLQIMGLREQGRAARIAGEREKMNADFRAWEAERESGIGLAISQRAALEERRQADLQASRALAVAAASGGGVSDPTIVDLLARTEGEGAYRAAVALYEGEARARALKLEAAGARVMGSEARAEGLARQHGYALAGVGQALRAGGSLYARYGMNGPGTLPKTAGSGDAALITDSLPTGNLA